MCCGLGALACCFGSAACSCCCAACPSCKNSTSTRIVYGLFLLVGAVVSAVFLLPQVDKALSNSPLLCQDVAIIGQLIPSQVCERLAGYRSVYRVSFGVAAFFFLLSIIMINVKSSKDMRAPIQNGFWFFKFLVMCGLCVAAFFIPNGSFENVFMYFGMIGAFSFIVIQLVLLVDFAHSWNESWVGRMEDSEHKGWYCALMSSTIIMYLVALTGFILFYIFYIGTGNQCSLHKFFISFNLILCVVMSVVSILPKVQEAMPRSGLLQSAVISMYTMYLTWSSMSNNPDMTCNPSITTIIHGTGNSTVHNEDVGSAENWASFAIWLICLIYACIRTASTNNVGKLTGSEDGLQYGTNEKTLLGSTNASAGDTKPADGDAEKWGQEVYDNEDDGVAYSYTFFHIMLMLAAFYMMMTLTSWFQPSGANFDSLAANSGAMWVKISSSWVCVALYLWTLVAPIILSDRDFS
ncbi:probable serine incorporator isoform X2 [Lytechinus variegatus]|uniref:probable serine incorporator isoform X2 n=1 Tax=Lytechinus variegatus TaxID=7654 RepID=UPI001BB1BAB6|nr:probable serine incorporator isoform X2 [Lytechinus variegatus]